MNIQENNIIGELVAQDYRMASVFKKYNIDFCCQGNRTIRDACQASNIDIAPVLADLNEIYQKSSETFSDYSSWSLDEMVDHIEKKHHRYVEDKIQEIKPYLDKICKVHGERHPELMEINILFNQAANELLTHMKKEEMILFPFIRRMVKAEQENVLLSTPHFGTVQNPIRMMMHEHSNEGELFKKIQELSNKYTPPEDACNTYQVTFALLKEFEDDLHLHIHLENNILFPKTAQLEKQLTNI